MVDFTLFLWELLVSFFGIVTHNPWIEFLGRIVAYIFKKLLKKDHAVLPNRDINNKDDEKPISD